MWQNRAVSALSATILLTGTSPAAAMSLQRAIEQAAMRPVAHIWGDIHHPADVVVADLRARPEQAGSIQAWRESGLSAPILVLADPGGAHLEALEHRADDYLLAPFAPTEVVSRVQALLRRGRPPVRRIALSDGHIDLDSRQVVRERGSARLTATEARLLDFLARHPGTGFTREQLQTRVWGYRPGIRSRTVISTVQRVRAKIEASPAEPAHLVTTSAGGYRLQTAAAAAHTTSSPDALVGRQDELATLAGLLLDAQGAMLTLVGHGGIGKTHLARALAARLGPRFPDGAVFVELAGITEDGAALPTILAAVGAAPGPDPVAQLIDVLSQRALLLVLDNLEHLSGLPELLAAVLATGPAATLLGTSRVPMRLLRERVFPLEPLSAADAAALFEQTAARTRAGFALQAGDAEAIAGIVERVGRVPLAVVLAASWARTLPVADIAAELKEDLSLLDEGPRDLPARHRSIQAVFEGSWSLLSARQRSHLAALSVFLTPFSRAAARAVAGAGLSDLLRLVDASLLRRSGDSYTLHPLLTELARAKLAAGEQTAVMERYDAWFSARLRACSLQLSKSQEDERAPLAELERTRADLWAAWCRACERLDLTAIAEGGTAMLREAEGSPRMCHAVAPLLRRLGPPRAEEPDARRALRAFAVTIDAAGRGTQGDPGALDEVRRCVEVLRPIPLPQARFFFSVACLLRHVLSMYDGVGSWEDAAESVQAMDAVGYTVGRLDALGALAFFLARDGEHRRAEDAITAAHQQLPATGRMRGRLMMYTGAAWWEMERLTEARHTLSEGRAVLSEARDTTFLVWTSNLLIDAEARLGLPEALSTARETLDEALLAHIPLYPCLGVLGGVASAWARGLAPPPEGDAYIAQIAALSRFHPAALAFNRRIATEALSILEARMAPEAFAEAVARGRWLELTPTVHAVLEQL